MKHLLSLLAEQLYNKISYIEVCRPHWKTAIYYAVLNSNNVNSVIEWSDDYNQWKLAHQLRANKANAKKEGITLDSNNIVITNCQRENIEIKATFSDGKVLIIKLYLTDFKNDLWSILNNNGVSILLDEEEAILIFDYIKGFCTNNVIEDEHPKFYVLTELLKCAQLLYAKLNDKKQKAFLETIIGAGVFYLPNKTEWHFSGYISFEAIKEFLNGGKLVKDHIIPRRRTASIILHSQYELNQLAIDYHTRYANFMYVTSLENKILVNYSEDNYDDALIRLGIRKFPSPDMDRFSHNELFDFFNYIKNESLAINEYNDALNALIDYRLSISTN